MSLKTALIEVLGWSIVLEQNEKQQEAISLQ